jgi:predicted metal-dependent peptidase
MKSTAGGKVQHRMLRHVAQVTGPPLEWRTLLWRFLLSTLVDFAGFDQRFTGREMYLEKLAGEIVRVRVAVDTSGSISSADLGVLLFEVCGILNLYRPTHQTLIHATCDN